MWVWEDGSSNPVVAAVLDVGVDNRNWDINFWDGPDTTWGYNFYNDNYNPKPQIISGVWTDHGTGVAGIIGAISNNDEGVAGVAGGYGSGGAEIMALRVGYYYENALNIWVGEIDGSVVDDAIEYAADNGAKIINMSFGISSTSAINSAINYAYKKKGCLLVAATGNGNKSTDFGYPASHSFVMAISGIAKNEDAYGDYGGTIDVVAPSEAIYTTSNYTNNDHYYYRNWGTGTSASAPQVAGAAALLWSFEPDGLTPVLLHMDIRNLINQTADDNVGGATRFGNGLLFPGAAFEWLDESPLSTPPTISISGGLGSHPTISWSKVGNDISYKVYRAESAEGRYFFVQKANIPYDSGTQTYSWMDNSVTINSFGSHTYYYRVTSINDGVESVTSNEQSCKSYSVEKPIGESLVNAEKFELYHNYPNPFNPVTNFRFNLPKEQRVIIKVYDISGKLVNKLVDNTLKKGRNSVRFDAEGLASGVYIYTIQAGDIKLTRKMMLLQ